MGITSVGVSRDGYVVICGGVVTHVWALEDAASVLAAAFRDGVECRIYACRPGGNRRQELTRPEREELVTNATSLLVSAAA